MYSTCLYCNQDLGANQVIELFPVGRRLAFDQARGRLWVVCRKCEKWSLSPLEERWEAIEDCERRFHDARKRVASDNIGLARLDEGLELVRIGEPLRPEFAAWRYGDQFGRRRRRAVLVGSGLVALGGGVVIAGAWTGVLSGGGYAIYQLVEAAVRGVKRRRIVARVPIQSGERVTVRGRHLEKTCLHVPAGGDHGWGLHLPHEGGVQLLVGDHARRAAALIMPKVNSGGGSPRKVQEAVRRIEVARDPASYLEAVAREVQPRFNAKVDHSLLPKLALETRLAIEMAVNEEHERIVLEGELALLELEWKEAEEIAAIADRLLVPEDVELQLEQMRQQVGRDRPS